jgi:hypothetical protein
VPSEDCLRPLDAGEEALEVWRWMVATPSHRGRLGGLWEDRSEHSRWRIAFFVGVNTADICTCSHFVSEPVHPLVPFDSLSLDGVAVLVVLSAGFLTKPTNQLSPVAMVVQALGVSDGRGTSDSCASSEVIAGALRLVMSEP